MAKKKSTTTTINGNFAGSVDDLLLHCSNLDADQVEEQVKSEEKQNCIEYIKNETGCTNAEAEEVYNEIALKEVADVVNKLVEDGFLEIVGIDEKGEPKYALTELGLQMRKQMEQ